MKTKLLFTLALILKPAVFFSSAAEPPKSRYAPVVAKEPFSETMARMKTEKPAVMKKQMDLLQQRYDLRNDRAPAATNLKAERFYKPRLINGAMAGPDGPIKTFPLRGIKDSPPYLQDGWLLTLEDTVEFSNLILETKLTAPEKTDLVAFLRAL
jgi:hypothetical protein